MRHLTMPHGDRTGASAPTDISSTDTSNTQTVDPERFVEAYVVDGDEAAAMRFVATPTEWVESSHLMEVRR